MASLKVACYVEHQKLKRSLALLLAAVIPLLIGVFTFFNVLRGHAPKPWDMWIQSGAAIWAFFMLPMGITALTALIAQVEHASHSWNHLRALPVPRWHVHAAKALWSLAALALMSLCVALATGLAVVAAAWVKPVLTPTGSFHALAYAGLFARIYLASFLLVAVQLWLALRYSHFVPALATGIGGTFFAVVGTSARVGMFSPWQIPVNMLAADPWRAHLALGIGLMGGLLALLAMVWQLGRREVA